MLLIFIKWKFYIFQICISCFEVHIVLPQFQLNTIQLMWIHYCPVIHHPPHPTGAQPPGGGPKGRDPRVAISSRIEPNSVLPELPVTAQRCDNVILGTAGGSGIILPRGRPPLSLCIILPRPKWPLHGWAPVWKRKYYRQSNGNPGPRDPADRHFDVFSLVLDDSKL